MLEVAGAAAAGVDVACAWHRWVGFGEVEWHLHFDWWMDDKKGRCGGL